MLQRPLNRLRGANDDEKGFTLIELLVVILIIGILAAIALPTLLGQHKKAQDAAAKSNARNAVTQVEACLTVATSATAAACGTSANAGLAALKNVVVTGAGLDATDGGLVYSIEATSESTKTYTITKIADGTATYSTTATDPKWLENSTTP